MLQLLPPGSAEGISAHLCRAQASAIPSGYRSDSQPWKHQGQLAVSPTGCGHELHHATHIHVYTHIPMYTHGYRVMSPSLPSISKL